MYLDEFSDVNIFDLNKASQISGYHFKIKVFFPVYTIKGFSKIHPVVPANRSLDFEAPDITLPERHHGGPTMC